MKKSPLTNLREHYINLLDQDTPFIETFGTLEQKKNWAIGRDILHTANTKVSLVNAGDLMGSIRQRIHQQNITRTDYRLLYLQRGPQKYEDLKRDLGQDIADTIQKLRDAKKKE